MTKQTLIDTFSDLKNDLRLEPEVKGASELTIERVIDALDSLINTLKNDES